MDLRNRVSDVLANIADFDDPNIDHKNAVIGMLGEHGRGATQTSN